MATAINDEIGARDGARDGGGPLEVASEVEMSDNAICVADSTVPCDVTDEAVVEPTSGSEGEGESVEEISSDSGEEDVALGDIRPASPPILQGRLIRLTDYLPNDDMPDLSYSNPAHFWFSGY